MIELKLPAIGEGVVEVEIVRWVKQPGDVVALNEALVEVMTDKATVEIPSPHAGRLVEQAVVEGETAAVGRPLCTLEPLGEASRAAEGPAEGGASTAAPATTVRAPATAPRGDRVLATPAARAYAREAGIDLAQVPSERGRITKQDLLAAPPKTPAIAPPPLDPPAPRPRPAEPAVAAPPAGPAPGSTPPAATANRIPFRGVRRRIAEGLARSYATAVHYTYVDEVDVTRLVAVREQAKAAAAREGVSLNYLPFIVKAVLRGLKKFPIVNASLDEDRGEIVLHDRYDIGIATATPQGLVVPVLRGADRKSLLDVAAEIGSLCEAAREGRASRDALIGSTFTVTSLGAIGGLHATPILNHPEVGILGVHAIRKVPVVDEHDAIVVGHVMNLSITLDHRVVDGFEGASFLQEVKRHLQDPTLLLLAGI